MHIRIINLMQRQTRPLLSSTAKILDGRPTFASSRRTIRTTDPTAKPRRRHKILHSSIFKPISIWKKEEKDSSSARRVDKHSLKLSRLFNSGTRTLALLMPSQTT